MGEGRERQDIVAFYNAAFLPAMQSVIHSLPLLNHQSPVSKESPNMATVPHTPKLTADPTHSRHRGTPTALHQPSIHSPILATSHLSRRVHLEMSPMKHTLSRSIPTTSTPCKLHLLTDLLVIREVECEEGGSPDASRMRKPVVARRLDF